MKILKICSDGWALIIVKWFISVHFCVSLHSVMKTEPLKIIWEWRTLVWETGLTQWWGDVAGFRESLVAHTETTEWPWERGETSKDPFKQGSFLWRMYWQQRGGAAQNIRNQHFSKILIKTWEKHDKVRHGLSVQLLCKRNFWGYLAAVQRTGHWKNRPNGIITPTPQSSAWSAFSEGGIAWRRRFHHQARGLAIV